MWVHRPIVITRRGIVVAGHHLAAEAGATVLREGGNAMDAAVTAAAALSVAIPHMNGLGGDAFGLWFDQTSGEVVCINGSGGAPMKATREYYLSLGLQEVPLRGPLSISVPGILRSWNTALERFGTISLKTALSPAIDWAENGVPIDRPLQNFFNGPIYGDLCERFPSLVKIFQSPGLRPLGDLLRQPALTKTLREIAHSGISSLYGGEIGRAVVKDVTRAGGLLTLEDLAFHTTELQTPLSMEYKGVQVFAAPPNSQGLALLLLLGMLDASRGSEAPLSREFFQRFIELKHVAFRLRDQLVGDPRVARIPENLLTPASFAEFANNAPQTDKERGKAGGGDTTCVVAMDEAGNAVSWVQSLFEEFGSGVLSESTGIVLHNRLHLASLEEGHPNMLTPKHRPFHTLCPALVLDNGRCRLAIATPGDHGQPQSLAQVITLLWDGGMDIQQAIEAPRIRHDSGREILYENRLDAQLLAPLGRSGYKLRDVGPWSRLMGGVNAIYSPQKGLRMGGADPRRASYAIAQ